MKNFKKTLKVFLKLKCQEIWEGVKDFRELVYGVLIIIGISVLACIYKPIAYLTGNPNSDLIFIEPILTVCCLGLLVILCFGLYFGIMGIYKRLGLNWKQATKIVEETNEEV